MTSALLKCAEWIAPRNAVKGKLKLKLKLLSKLASSHRPRIAKGTLRYYQIMSNLIAPIGIRQQMVHLSSVPAKDTSVSALNPLSGRCDEPHSVEGAAEKERRSVLIIALY